MIGANLSGNNPSTHSGQALSVADISGFTHGTGFLDANGFIHYTPDANYFGAVGFEYSLRAANDAMERRAA